MERDKPWFILVILTVIGIVIVLIGYYVNLYNNPDKYIKRYLIVKEASQEKGVYEDERFNFYNQASITIKTNNPDLDDITCQRDHRLLECNDGFNHYYTINNNDIIMTNLIFSKNTYEMKWQTNTQYQMFGLYPYVLIFDQAVIEVLNNTNKNIINERDLFNGIYYVYGTGDKIGKTNNYYQLNVSKTDTKSTLKITPQDSNVDSIFPYSVELSYTKNNTKIKLNRNMFK